MHGCIVYVCVFVMTQCAIAAVFCAVRHRCWLLWPHRSDNWRLNAEPAQRAYADVAKAIAQFEPVTVCVPAAHYQRALELLDHDNITVVEMTSDDAWIRDTGPTFVVKDHWLTGRQVRAVDWLFNAYGGLYKPYDNVSASEAVCDCSIPSSF